MIKPLNTTVDILKQNCMFTFWSKCSKIGCVYVVQWTSIVGSHPVMTNSSAIQMKLIFIDVNMMESQKCIELRTQLYEGLMMTYK
jgi:hypothetical protein